MTKDALGDRIKRYEAQETGRTFLPGLPVIMRIDGRSFSKFTKGMDRPFDANLHFCMVETTKVLVKDLGALAGYTQSDEISLLLHVEQTKDTKSMMVFDSKPFKLTSVGASLATAAFGKFASHFWPDKFTHGHVTFDCRAFQVPNKTEAANAFLWREQDATKNAVSMAARTFFSHAKLQDKSGPQMQEMMFQKKGVNFNDYPDEFKRGTFVLRRTTTKPLDPDVLARIPEKHRPTGPVERQVIASVKMPKFSTVTNRVGVLFGNEEPLTVSEGN